jgi:hypothetical protein
MCRQKNFKKTSTFTKRKRIKFGTAKITTVNETDPVLFEDKLIHIRKPNKSGTVIHYFETKANFIGVK